MLLLALLSLTIRRFYSSTFNATGDASWQRIRDVCGIPSKTASGALHSMRACGRCETSMDNTSLGRRPSWISPDSTGQILQDYFFFQLVEGSKKRKPVINPLRQFC